MARPILPLGRRHGIEDDYEIAEVTAWIRTVVASIDSAYAALPAGEVPGVRRAPSPVVVAVPDVASAPEEPVRPTLQLVSDARVAAVA